MLRWGLCVIYAFTAVLGRPAFAQTNPSVAFFYGKPVPVGQLGRFDWVVVEPDHLDARGLDELQRAGVQVFAYLSLGEAAPEAIDPGWILGRNAPWGSVIVDPRAAGWRSRILARVDALAARGFHGLFLDTLDSGAEPHSPIIDLIAERLQALGCAVDYLDVRRGLPREPNG